MRWSPHRSAPKSPQTDRNAAARKIRSWTHSCSLLGTPTFRGFVLSVGVVVVLACLSPFRGNPRASPRAGDSSYIPRDVTATVSRTKPLSPQRLPFAIMTRLDDKINRYMEKILPPKLDPDNHLLYFLLQEIARHSSGELNKDTKFLEEKFSDPEKGPSLREKLAKAWDEKKYQSIRAIGRNGLQRFQCVFHGYLTDYLRISKRLPPPRQGAPIYSFTISLSNHCLSSRNIRRSIWLVG